MQSQKQITETNSKGTFVYHSLLHNEVGPALITVDGEEWWYRMGALHRDNGPAVKRLGHQFWYRDGQYHRGDGPAVIFKNGHQLWYENGVFVKEINKPE